MRLAGWNEIPEGYGARFDSASAPGWLRLMHATPFLDRFRYPLLVQRGFGFLGAFPGRSESELGRVSGGWRIDDPDNVTPGSLPAPGREQVAAPPGRAAWHTAGMASENIGEVRAWAKQQGLKVSDRGRLPTSLLNAYHASIAAETAPTESPATKLPARSAPAKRKPSSRGRKPTVRAAKVQHDASLPNDPGMFGDPQSILRRLTSLERQVSDLVGNLEAAAHALDPSHSQRR